MFINQTIAQCRIGFLAKLCFCLIYYCQICQSVQYGVYTEWMQEEVFGPVVVINTFSTETEAIEKANNSEFGLHAALFTKDIDRAVRLAKALDAGTVGVNCTSPTNAKDTAFGGFKMSGNGREGLLYI